MCYVSGKSTNKIVHRLDCRYVKMMPAKNKKYFSRFKEASDAGYVQCKYCAPIKEYLKKEEKDLRSYCNGNGLFYSFNNSDGSLDIISRTGKWKIIVNGQKNFIWLYHMNTDYRHDTSKFSDMVPGYHSQNVRKSTLLGYMSYIVNHDNFRHENPLYGKYYHPNRIKGSKRWRKERKRADRIRRAQSIDYVLSLLDGMSAGVFS